MNSISREQKVLEIFLPYIFLPQTHAASMSRAKELDRSSFPCFVSAEVSLG